VKVQQIPIDQIREPALLPRFEDDEAGIAELAESIKLHGLLQPLVVRKEDDGYRLIAGFRRLRAVKSLGWEKVPASVVKPGEITDEELTLVENLMRKDLDPVEEAAAFAEILERTGWTHEELADRLGKTRPYVTKRLMLLKLDPVTAQAVHEGLITMTVALELLRVDDVPTRQLYLEHAIKFGSNVETVRYWVENWLREKQAMEARGEPVTDVAPQPPPEEILVTCQICQRAVPVSEVRGITICAECLRAIREGMAEAAEVVG